jgi:hypothetical protein
MLVIIKLFFIKSIGPEVKQIIDMNLDRRALSQPFVLSSYALSIESITHQ